MSTGASGAVRKPVSRTGLRSERRQHDTNDRNQRHRRGLVPRLQVDFEEERQQVSVEVAPGGGDRVGVDGEQCLIATHPHRRITEPVEVERSRSGRQDPRDEAGSRPRRLSQGFGFEGHTTP